MDDGLDNEVQLQSVISKKKKKNPKFIAKLVKTLTNNELLAPKVEKSDSHSH